MRPSGPSAAPLKLVQGYFKVILVGDIGGTNVRFGVAQVDEGGRYHVSQFAKYPGDDFSQLEDAIAKYLSAADIAPKHMSLAIAGPLKNGAVTLTNRPWSVSEDGLKDRFAIESVCLFNDFAAMARSITELADSDFQSVHAGEALPGKPVLVAGAGTGFGVAYLVPSKRGWQVLSSEGGHVAYVPRTQNEMAVRSILEREYGFVSLELVSSGAGLAKVHKAVCERRGVSYSAYSPDSIREQARAGDPLCTEICRLRSHAIMGALGDLALAGGTRGGIVLAGGVSERMIEFLTAPDAMDVFLHRGSRTDYMKNMPITLLTNPIAPLIGAAALYVDRTK